MNWSRAKSILILLFLCINIFLCIYMIRADRSVSVVSLKTITQARALLEQNQILIEQDKIPTRIPLMHDIDADNAIADFSALGLKLVGEGYSTANKGNLFINGTKRMAVEVDSFIYENSKPTEYYPGLNESNAEDKAKEIVSWLGMDIKNTHSQVTRVDGNILEVTFVKMIGKYPLFDSVLTIKLSVNGLNGISGAWFLPRKKPMVLGTRIKSATGALIDFISDPVRPKDQPVTIKSMELGYLSGDASTHRKSVTAVPTWRLVTEDGRIYYMDARSR